MGMWTASALTLVADGHVDSVELDIFERAGAYERLGLSRSEIHAVLQGFCEDLLQAQQSHWAGACQIEPGTLNQLLAEVEDVEMRKAVLSLCVAVAEADSHIADGESIVLVSAVEQWGLQYQMLRPSEPA